MKALTYMFKDNMIGKKFAQVYLLLIVLLILSVFTPFFKEPIRELPLAMAFPIASIILIVKYLSEILIWGYLISCLKSNLFRSENIILPFVNFKRNLIVGIKYFLATFFMALAMIALVCLIMLLYKIAPSLGVIGGLFGVIIILKFLFFSLALTSLFAKTEDIFVYFKFKKAYQLIKGNVGRYIISSLKLLLIAILVIPVLESEWLSPILVNIVAFVTLPYLIYVIAYITANAIDKNRLE